MGTFILILYVVALGLGVLTGYFGVATAFSDDIQRKFIDLTEWKKGRNDAEFIKRFFGLLNYTSQLKEFSLII